MDQLVYSNISYEATGYLQTITRILLAGSILYVCVVIAYLYRIDLDVGYAYRMLQVQLQKNGKCHQILESDTARALLKDQMDTPYINTLYKVSWLLAIIIILATVVMVIVIVVNSDESSQDIWPDLKDNGELFITYIAKAVGEISTSVLVRLPAWLMTKSQETMLMILVCIGIFYCQVRLEMVHRNATKASEEPDTSAIRDFVRNVVN